MKCKAVLKEIEELEPGAAFSTEAEKHLAACASCHTFARERAALRLLVGSLDKISAPPDFDWRLRARLAETKPEREPARRWLQGFAPGAQAITVAASVALLLVAVVIYRQSTFTPPGRTQVASTDIKETARPKTVDDSSKAVSARPSVQTSDSAGNRESRTSDAVRQRITRSAKAVGARTENVEASLPQRQIYSTDFGSRGAEETNAAGLQNSFTNGGPVISVRVPSPKSAQLRFEDGQGTRRTLSSVSFGGQELTGRPDKARIVPASEKGIW